MVTRRSWRASGGTGKWPGAASLRASSSPSDRLWFPLSSVSEAVELVCPVFLATVAERCSVRVATLCVLVTVVVVVLRLGVPVGEACSSRKDKQSAVAFLPFGAFRMAM